MNKAGVIDRMSQISGLPKYECEKAIDALVETVQDGLLDDGKVMIKGFLSFEVREYAPRMGRDPITGDVIKYESSKSVRCKISPVIKDMIKG